MASVDDNLVWAVALRTVGLLLSVFGVLTAIGGVIFLVVAGQKRCDLSFLQDPDPLCGITKDLWQGQGLSYLIGGAVLLVIGLCFHAMSKSHPAAGASSGEPGRSD